MKHIMLDLETLGTKPGCVILSIGAVVFDPFTRLDLTLPPQQPAPDFYRNIDLFSSLMAGLEIEQATVEWWRGQSDEAKQAFTSSMSPYSLRTALIHFSEWLTSVESSIDDIVVWAKSPSFDCAILRAAYRACGIATPWSFRNEADVRTAYLLHDYKEPKTGDGVKHNALDDAKFQANNVRAAIYKDKA